MQLASDLIYYFYYNYYTREIASSILVLIFISGEFYPFEHNISVDYLHFIFLESQQWIYNADQHSMEFIYGMHESINAAEKHKYGGFVHYPCKFCRNEKDYSSSRTIHSHLFSSDFMPNYYVWTKLQKMGQMLREPEKVCETKKETRDLKHILEAYITLLYSDCK